jgi:ubiquinone/menaquinone biosynthesis C-methylase UbiE
MNNPAEVQESAYRLPYHWFPEDRLMLYERREKQRLVFDLIDKYCRNDLSKYLDVGCGDGRWTVDIFEYLERQPEAYGIDISDRAIAFAGLIEPRVRFRVGDADRLPFEDGSFDFVSAIEVIEHMVDGSDELALREMARVLRVNGTLLITTPTWNLRMPPHHYRHYSVAQILQLLNDAGFDVLEVLGQALPCYGLKRKIRRYSDRFPALWRLWRYTYRQTRPEEALDLIIAARPGTP